MKTKAKKSKVTAVGTKKVAGHLVAGKAVSDLFLFLKDGKEHPLAAAKKIAQRHHKQLTGRLANLRRVCRRKKLGTLVVDWEAGTVKLQVNKSVLNKVAPSKVITIPSKKEAA
jgi:hypothetical protein